MSTALFLKRDRRPQQVAHEVNCYQDGFAEEDSYYLQKKKTDPPLGRFHLPKHPKRKIGLKNHLFREGGYWQVTRLIDIFIIH